MIRYVTELDNLTPADFEGFFVGWPDPPSPARHLDILRGSQFVVLAIDEASGAVVGFIHALSDGVLSAFVPLLEVFPPIKEEG